MLEYFHSRVSSEDTEQRHDNAAEIERAAESKPARSVGQQAMNKYGAMNSAAAAEQPVLEMPEKPSCAVRALEVARIALCAP